MVVERLQKIIAQAGIASRRKAEELIIDGKVKVNGKVVTELGTKADPLKDEIEVNGKLIKQEKLVYILLNKPKGYIATADDPQNRPIVFDLIKGIPQRLHSVGRLDYDTAGLLLLTNDGDLTYKLTHPKFRKEKIYLVRVKGRITQKVIKNLERGVELEDGMTAPAKVDLVKLKRDFSLLKLTIREGRNRQIRRMMEAVEFPVIYLKRIQMGPLTLGKLKTGQYRHLTQKEINLLKK